MNSTESAPTISYGFASVIVAVGGLGCIANALFMRLLWVEGLLVGERGKATLHTLLFGHSTATFFFALWFHGWTVANVAAGRFVGSCRVNGFLSMFSASLMIGHLCLMSEIRRRTVTNQFKLKLSTYAKLYAGLVALVLLVSALAIGGVGQVHLHESGLYCNQDYSLLPSRVIIVLAVSSGLVILVVTYTMIWLVVRRTRQMVTHMVGDNAAHIAREAILSQKILTIVISFILLWTPAFVQGGLAFFDGYAPGSSSRSAVLDNMVALLVAGNILSDPLLFVFLDTTVRKALARRLEAWPCCSRLLLRGVDNLLTPQQQGAAAGQLAGGGGGGGGGRVAAGRPGAVFVDLGEAAAGAGRDKRAGSGGGGGSGGGKDSPALHGDAALLPGSPTALLSGRSRQLRTVGSATPDPADGGGGGERGRGSPGIPPQLSPPRGLLSAVGGSSGGHLGFAPRGSRVLGPAGGSSSSAAGGSPRLLQQVLQPQQQASGSTASAGGVGIVVSGSGGSPLGRHRALSEAVSSTFAPTPATGLGATTTAALSLLGASSNNHDASSAGAAGGKRRSSNHGSVMSSGFGASRWTSPQTRYAVEPSASAVAAVASSPQGALQLPPAAAATAAATTIASVSSFSTGAPVLSPSS